MRYLNRIAIVRATQLRCTATVDYCNLRLCFTTFIFRLKLFEPVLMTKFKTHLLSSTASYICIIVFNIRLIVTNIAMNSIGIFEVREKK